MTEPFHERVRCPGCGVLVSTEPPIKAWIRNHNSLDSRQACLCVGDSDLWVHRYGTRSRGIVNRDVKYLMLVEIKTHGREPGNEQRELLEIVSALLRTKAWKTHRDNGQFTTGHLSNARNVYARIANREVQVLCYGVHSLRLSGSTPGDSDSIKWDTRPINQDQVLKLLRFDLNPDSLEPMEHRSHKRVDKHPTLLNFNAQMGGPS